MSDTFTCAACGETFTKGRSDDEAKAESQQIFGLIVTEETHAVVCDDCFKRLAYDA